MYNYRPQRSCGQSNVFTGVCLSTGGGVCLSACWDARPPTPQPPNSPRPGRPIEPGRPPPQTRQTPRPGRSQRPDQADPPPGSRLQHTVYERPVRILLECILVKIVEKTYVRNVVHFFFSLSLGELSISFESTWNYEKACYENYEEDFTGPISSIYWSTMGSIRWWPRSIHVALLLIVERNYPNCSRSQSLDLNGP